jgi:hypothetical protein
MLSRALEKAPGMGGSSTGKDLCEPQALSHAGRVGGACREIDRRVASVHDANITKEKERTTSRLFVCYSKYC